MDSIKDLLDYIKDTVIISGKSQVVEPLLPDDMESFGVFVMLTEESRRDRIRRVNLGDESAKLKLAAGQVGTVAAASGTRPGLPVVSSAARPMTMPMARPVGTSVWQRPAANSVGASYRPLATTVQTGRPYQPSWQFGR